MTIPEPYHTGLLITVMGLVTVFAVLATIAMIVYLMQRLDEYWSGRDSVPTVKEPTIDDLTLVLITAAVATVIEGRFHIRRVRRLGDNDRGPSAWTQRGRAVLQGSHSISKKGADT
ncbi:MAG: OadG family protein [Proteobacteria bacterium]|jgi:hypothetical protein|nr:OadG family protein [Pseudomonadota bacterium]